MPKLSIVIPVYNEAGAIRQVLNLVQAADTGKFEKEIILVDDGSIDGTRDILRKLEKENRYKIIYHENNLGKGGALKTGFREATGDYVLIQDADMEYNPGEYGKLLQPITAGYADVVFGSRVLGKNNVPFSSTYFYGGLLITKLFNMFFNTKFSDIATCYKIFPKKYIPELILQPAQDFVFDVVELSHSLAKKEKIYEIPISYFARSKAEGKKLNWKHGLKCATAIIRIRLALDPLVNYLRYGKVLKYVRDDANVLDVGCGPNTAFLNIIKEKIKSGCGIDKKADPKEFGNLNLLKFDLDSGDLPSGLKQYDQIFMLASIEHMAKPKEILLELNKILKNGGEMYITTPTVAAKPVLEFLSFRLNLIDRAEILDHKQYFSKRALRNILEETGFKVKKHKYFEMGMNQIAIAVKKI